MQMVFTQETTVLQVEEKGTSIAHEAFDFYDHSELMQLTNQTTYLAGLCIFLKFMSSFLTKYVLCY